MKKSPPIFFAILFFAPLFLFAQTSKELPFPDKFSLVKERAPFWCQSPKSTVPNMYVEFDSSELGKTLMVQVDLSSQVMRALVWENGKTTWFRDTVPMPDNQGSALKMFDTALRCVSPITDDQNRPHANSFQYLSVWGETKPGPNQNKLATYAQQIFDDGTATFYKEVNDSKILVFWEPQGENLGREKLYFELFPSGNMYFRKITSDDTLVYTPGAPWALALLKHLLDL
ncbi:MAG: hypothetical protein AAB438_01435 [Patescibacteria group bacterium]